jgi:hypothetical protein
MGYGSKIHRFFGEMRNRERFEDGSLENFVFMYDLVWHRCTFLDRGDLSNDVYSRKIG